MRQRIGLAAGVLASGLAGCAATMPRTPADVSSLEVERYRFGMYQECLAAGAVRGASAAAARAFCDCVDDVLSRNVDEAAWRRLVLLNEEGRSQEERQALAPMLAGVSLCRAAVAPAGAAPNVAPASGIQGVWTWTRPFDGCKETFEFRANGTARFERGDERTDYDYRLAAAPEASGRYRVDIAPTWSAPGETCDGGFRDASERKAPVYVLFGARFESLAVCDSASGEDCAGPLHRVRE